MALRQSGQFARATAFSKRPPMPPWARASVAPRIEQREQMEDAAKTGWQTSEWERKKEGESKGHTPTRGQH